MKKDAKLPDEAEPVTPAIVPKGSAREYFCAANTEGDDKGLSFGSIAMAEVCFTRRCCWCSCCIDKENTRVVNSSFLWSVTRKRQSRGLLYARGS